MNLPWGSSEAQSGMGRFSLLLELPHDLLSCGSTSHPGKPGPGSTKWVILLTKCFLLSWPLATVANAMRDRKLFRLAKMTPQKVNSVTFLKNTGPSSALSYICVTHLTFLLHSPSTQ